MNDVGRQVCRGMMLLEVILALTILFMGMAVMGIQLRTAIMTGYENESMTQAMMLAEAKLGQLDSGGIDLDRELGADGLMEGDFGTVFPGYFWRFQFEPHDDIPELFDVQLQILYGPPEDDLEPGSMDDAEVVVQLHAQRPTPPKLDLQRDFGFSEEQIEEVAAVLPPELDPSDLSPSFLATMNLEDLLPLLPTLLATFGEGFIPKEQLQQAIDQGLIDPTEFQGLIDGGRGGGRGRGDGGDDGGPPSMEEVLETLPQGGGLRSSGTGLNRSDGSEEERPRGRGRGRGRGNRR